MTSSDQDDLIKLLESAVCYVECDDCLGGNVISEAASTLRAQAARIAELEHQLASAQAMKNIAYRAGYYQAECGLPEHTEHVADDVYQRADFRKARNDALREVKAKVWDGTYHISPKAAQKAVDIICAINEGTDND